MSATVSALSAPSQGPDRSSGTPVAEDSARESVARRLVSSVELWLRGSGGASASTVAVAGPASSAPGKAGPETSAGGSKAAPAAALHGSEEVGSGKGEKAGKTEAQGAGEKQGGQAGQNPSAEAVAAPEPAVSPDNLEEPAEGSAASPEGSTDVLALHAAALSSPSEDGPLPVMDVLATMLLKDYNSLTIVVSFISQRGPEILRAFLQSPGLWKSSPKTRATVVLFTALAMRHVRLSELGFFANDIVDLMCREPEQSGFTSDLLALLETYCRALLGHGQDLPEPQRLDADSSSAHPGAAGKSSGGLASRDASAAPAAVGTPGAPEKDTPEAGDRIDEDIKRALAGPSGATPVYKLLQAIGIKQGEVLGGDPELGSLSGKSPSAGQASGQGAGEQGTASPAHPAGSVVFSEPPSSANPSGAKADDPEPLEPDRCSHLLKALSALLVLPRQKLEFCAFEGFASLAGIAAQTLSASVASGVVSCFHSCVFNVVDSYDSQAAANGREAGEHVESSSESSDRLSPEKAGISGVSGASGHPSAAETPFKTVYAHYSMIRPGLLAESVLEKGFLPLPSEFPQLEPAFVPSDPALRKKVRHTKPLAPRLAVGADLMFNVAMILRDTLQPETAELATPELARLLVDYMCVQITEFETQVRVFSDALLRVLGLAKDGDAILAGLLRDGKLAAKSLYLLGHIGNVENAAKICTLLSLCTGMVLGADSSPAGGSSSSAESAGPAGPAGSAGSTRPAESKESSVPADAPRAASSVKQQEGSPLAAAKSPASGAFQLIPMDFVATSSVPGVRCTTFDIRALLRYISIFGGQILDGKLDMVHQVQVFDDACLTLVWLIESSREVGDEVPSIRHENGEMLKRYARTKDSTVSSRLWNMLSVQKEAHGLLLLSAALDTIPGLLVTMPGLLSVIASLMAVPGFYALCIQAFPDKTAAMANFLVSLCASLAQGEAVNYVLCHSILTGLSTNGESIRAADPNILARAMVPLAALETDEILLRIISHFETVPDPVKAACEEIMALLGEMDAS